MQRVRCPNLAVPEYRPLSRPFSREATAQIAAAMAGLGYDGGAFRDTVSTFRSDRPIHHGIAPLHPAFDLRLAERDDVIWGTIDHDRAVALTDELPARVIVALIRFDVEPGSIRCPESVGNLA